MSLCVVVYIYSIIGVYKYTLYVVYNSLCEHIVIINTQSEETK